jgi:CubicO group peptidase (beta-lactamase class C family)
MIAVAALALVVPLLAGLADLEREIPRLMEQADIPGLSMVVIRDGKVAWHGAFGERHGVKDGKTDGPVTDETVFAAASLSKQVFTYAVLRMADRGEIDLDKPLCEYLPYPRLEGDERYRRITARMALTHTAGLPNWGGTPLKLLYTPGQRFSYSGEGFVYLQKVVEKLTGLTLNDVAQREVLGPLGMHRSSYVAKPELEGNMVIGRDSLDQPQRLTPDEGNAAASLLTTALDYSKFLMAELNGVGLRHETVEMLFAPAVAVQGKGPGSKGKIFWGLGWGLERTENGENFWQWGDNGAFKAFVIGNRGKRNAVAYFTNSEDGLSIVRAVLKLTFAGTHPAAEWLTGYEPYDLPKRLRAREIRRVIREQGVEAGMKRYRAVAREAPEIVDTTFANDLASYLLANHHPDEAVALYEESAEKADRDSARTHEMLANAYVRLGDDKQALAELEKALALFPGTMRYQRPVKLLRESTAAKDTPPAMTPETLRQLAGDYGDRHVVLRDGSLFYTSPPRAESRLIPITAEAFVVEGRPIERLRFVMNREGEAIKLVSTFLFGGEQELARVR